MAWETIAASDVLSEFTPTEKSALSHIQADHGDDNLPAILDRSVRKFRGAIRAGGQAVSDTAGEIPDDIRDDVIAHARWKFLIAFPQLRVMQTRERKDAHDEAIKVIEGLRKGELRVEDPDDEDAPPHSGQWGSAAKIHMRTDPETPET